MFGIYNSTVEPLEAPEPPWGQTKSESCREVKQESVYGLSTKKSGCCREVAVSGGWTVLLTFELELKAHNILSMKEIIFSYL